MREQTASLFSVKILYGAGQHSISLKKARVCVAWVFQGHSENFSGPLYRVEFSEFCQNSDSRSLIHSTKSHAPPQRLVIASLVHALSQD